MRKLVFRTRCIQDTVVRVWIEHQIEVTGPDLSIVVYVVRCTTEVLRVTNSTPGEEAHRSTGHGLIAVRGECRNFNQFK